MADAKKEVTEVVDAPVETPVVETPVVEAPVAAPDKSATHNHVAIRDFKTGFEHQILSFVKDEVIDSRVGHALRALGAPIKLVEKTAEEIKGLA